MKIENDYYYEPTGGTARNQDYLKRMFFEEREYIPKQQLISFLKDKIKNYEESIKNSKPYLEHEELFQQVQNDMHTDKCIMANLQEVLDFVNKGGDEK